eukprot:7465941-Ditylum_brightwellii.AAC.1
MPGCWSGQGLHVLWQPRHEDWRSVLLCPVNQECLGRNFYCFKPVLFCRGSHAGSFIKALGEE